MRASHATEYGAEVSSLPALLPSTFICTPATALLSVAFAVMFTVPPTVSPLLGAVIDTTGGMESGARVVKLQLWAVPSVTLLVALIVGSSRAV